MADGSDVKAIARDAFEDAHGHLDADLADAKTPAQARQVQDNHDATLSNYMAAIRTAFSCADQAWESALSDAQGAMAAVVKAREKAEKLVARLTSLAALTQAVGNVIDKAK